MAAPQDALAARAGSSEMEFLVRSCLWRRRVCLREAEANVSLRFVVGLVALGYFKGGGVLGCLRRAWLQCVM